MGCIYKRGSIYWIKYYNNGRPYLESSRSDREAEARRLLKRREGEISKGEIPGICFDKVRFDELAEDFLTDYRINGQKTLSDAERYVKNLKKSFGGKRATDITTAGAKHYIKQRMEDGLSNATINRELSALKRIFSLASKCTPPRVGQKPFIPMLEESNVRKGFFEHEEYLSLKSALPHYLKPVVAFAYYTGWRAGEILNLTWDRVDLKQGIISLNPGETKNDEARTIYLNDELKGEMRALYINRRSGCRYVFQRNGERIKRFTRAWRTACKSAGLNGRLFHDFRRTSARNDIRAGIPERVVMKTKGWKTRSVLDRYNIVNVQDLKEAALKQQVFIDSQTIPEMVTKTVTMGQPESPYPTASA